MPDWVTGVILAGGKSSRMGKDKATLVLNGQNMVAHMACILNAAGIENIVISGPSSFGTQYNFIADEQSQQYQGPAKAILNCLGYFPRGHGVLFVPVDMPLLDKNYLKCLLSMPQGACFIRHPLPIYIRNSAYVPGTVSSIRDIMNLFRIKEIPFPDKDHRTILLNANTPEDWEKGFSCEHQV